MRVAFVLSNSNAVQRSLVGGVFSYQKTYLIWACCYAAAAICAYLDKNALDTQNSNNTQNTAGYSSYSISSQATSFRPTNPMAESAKPKSEKTFEPVIGIETTALVKRAFIFMEDNNFDEAERYLEQALRQDPENSSAYLGKLMVELQVHSIDELCDTSISLKDNKLFQRALKFADDEGKIQLEHCLEANMKCQEAHEKAEIEQKYLKALDMMKTIETSTRAQNIINLLSSLANYKDTEALIQEIRQKKQEIEAVEKKYSEAWITKREAERTHDIDGMNKAAEMFEALGDYKDCKSLVEDIKCTVQKIIDEKKNRKLLVIISVIVLIVGCAVYGYMKFSEAKAARQAEEAKIESEKNEEKSRIDALKQELQNRKSSGEAR